jgi:hypothetical protein
MVDDICVYLKVEWIAHCGRNRLLANLWAVVIIDQSKICAEKEKPQ